MLYKKINEPLNAGAVNQLMDKELQLVFYKILRAREVKKWEGILSLLVKHSQPFTLFYLLLCGYFKLTARKFATGQKIAWQDDVAWMQANTPENHLLQQVIKEMEAACEAFNGELTHASEKYRALYYQNTMICHNPDNNHEDFNARMIWLRHMATHLEPENYDAPALELPDIKIPENLQQEYVAHAPLFHFYCDANYFKKFAKTYIEGVKSISDDYYIFAMVGNMDDEARLLAEEFKRKYRNFYIMEDNIPEKFQQPYNIATWCACRRFLYLETLLTQLDKPYLLVTDIDIVFSAKYKKVVEYGTDADISYFCNKAEIFNPRGIWCANQLFLTDTEFSRQFCRALSHFIRQKMAEDDRIYWYLDQFILLRLWHQMDIANHPRCKNIDDVSFNKPAVTYPLASEIKQERTAKMYAGATEKFDKETLRPFHRAARLG